MIKEMYVLTEIFTTPEGISYTTTNNILYDIDDAIDMFCIRCSMIGKTTNVNTIKHQFNQEEVSGIMKVELPNNSTIEIALSKLDLTMM